MFYETKIILLNLSTLKVQFEVTIAENVEAIVCCEAKISGERSKVKFS